MLTIGALLLHADGLIRAWLEMNKLECCSSLPTAPRTHHRASHAASRCDPGPLVNSLPACADGPSKA